jgi:hypothetical protein
MNTCHRGPRAPLRITGRPADIITCDNDEQAIDIARKLKRHFAVEV